MYGYEKSYFVDRSFKIKKCNIRRKFTGRNTRGDKSLQHVAATRRNNKFHRVNRRKFCRRDRTLSLQHVAQNQTGLILCDMLQRQNSVAATKF